MRTVFRTHRLCSSLFTARTAAAWFRATIVAIVFVVLALLPIHDGLTQTYQPPLLNGPTSSEAGVVNEATAVLEELVRGTATQIPEHLLASAEGVAIVPHYVRGAFVVGVAGGRGVLMTRDANRQWKAPELITIGGGSIGWQVGVQATDLVLVFRSPRSLDHIRTGKLTLGANASAAAGPIGRFASAATDASAKAEIFTYSKTRGLFAGVALDGASLQVDIPATQRYYQTDRGGPAVVSPSAISLVNELNRVSQLAAAVAATEPVVTNPATSTGPLPELATPGKVISLEPGNLATLESAVASLLTQVDDQWKQYLALPSSWNQATSLGVNEVYTTLARYERVDTNPQFAALKTLPAFHQAIGELRRLASLAPRNETLALPPPPSGDIDPSDVSRGRY